MGPESYNGFIFIKSIALLKRFTLFHALAINGVNPFRVSGMVLWFALLLLLNQLSRFLILVLWLTRSLFSLANSGALTFTWAANWQVTRCILALHYSMECIFGWWRRLVYIYVLDYWHFRLYSLMYMYHRLRYRLIISIIYYLMCMSRWSWCRLIISFMH